MKGNASRVMCDALADGASGEDAASSTDAEAARQAPAKLRVDQALDAASRGWQILATRAEAQGKRRQDASGASCRRGRLTTGRLVLAPSGRGRDQGPTEWKDMIFGISRDTRDQRPLVAFHGLDTLLPHHVMCVSM